jgi:TolB-like protein/Tfp pilus assembly protein PilF
MSFIEELRRRNVVRVAIAYALSAWVVLQGADFLLDLVGAPEWVIRVFAVAGLVGLPFALFFAWAFELTPEGIKREHEVDRSQSVAPQTGKKLNFVIIGLLLAVIVLMGVERLFFAGGLESGAEPDAAATPKTIAVLPFDDLSQAQDQAWFADGLAEEILNALVRVPDLSVTARTSSFVYKGSNKPISEIADELGVAHVLEGSVRSSGERIRVTAQLIRASDGFHLWSQNYDRDVADMISIQEDLARNIALALETGMDPEALARMAQAGTDSIEAYQEYLRGLQLQSEAFLFSNEGTLAGAHAHFESARQIDPGFFDAHVQAANYWKVELTPSRSDSGTSGLQPQQMMREYNERIGMAIDSARTEADRVRSLADRAMVDLRLREARRLFDQYLELRPNDELARFELASVLGMLSEREALREVMEYWEVKGQTDAATAASLVNEAYRVIDPGEAAELAVQALARWPNSSTLVYQAHRTLMWAGRYGEASQLAARYEALVPGGDPLIRAREACAAGDRDTAEEILTDLTGESDSEDRTSLWLLHNMLGNAREEIEVLRPLEASGIPFQLASFLTYSKFDPRPYPSLMAVLEREGVKRLPPATPPFRCPPPQTPSVAVLPFVNMSADAEQEYFSDGMTEEIINALVRVPDVKVAARTSVFAFKGHQQDVRSIGGELGVTHVVEGSVRSAGQQLRITAQLIQVADGFHLWSETFDRQRVNVFAIQEEIAAAIAGALNEQLRAGEAVQEVARISVEAYDDYLRGRAHLRERRPESLERARELFLAVTGTHPDYAPAWAALAITADVLDDHELAETSALRALELDPHNVDALTALGGVYRDTQRWAEAAASFERALAVDPDSAELMEDYGEFLARTGRFEELLEVTARGYAIDPYLVPLVEVYAIGLLAAGDRDRATEILRQTIARGSADWLYARLAVPLLEDRDTDGLRALVSEMPLAPEYKELYFEVLDRPDDAATLARLQGSLAPNYWEPTYGLSALLLLHLGQADFLVAAYAELVAAGFNVLNDEWLLPAYADLRTDPGFAALLESTGLPGWWDQSGWPDFCRRGDDGAITCT